MHYKISVQARLGQKLTRVVQTRHMRVSQFSNSKASGLSVGPLSVATYAGPFLCSSEFTDITHFRVLISQRMQLTGRKRVNKICSQISPYVLTYFISFTFDSPGRRCFANGICRKTTKQIYFFLNTLLYTAK